MRHRWVLAAFCLLAGLARPQAAYAEDDKAPPAPRMAVTIQGVSVVMVSVDDRLTVFVDRLSDNAPAEDAQIRVALAEGKSVPVTRMTDGLFVGPFKRAGRTKDAFKLSVTSADGTGEATGEIVYDDAKDVAPGSAGGDLRDKVVIALAAGAMGAIGGFVFMRRQAVQRRKAEPASIA